MLFTKRFFLKYILKKVLALHISFVSPPALCVFSQIVFRTGRCFMNLPENVNNKLWDQEAKVQLV